MDQIARPWNVWGWTEHQPWLCQQELQIITPSTGVWLATHTGFNQPQNGSWPVPPLPEIWPIPPPPEIHQQWDPTITLPWSYWIWPYTQPWLFQEETYNTEPLRGDWPQPQAHQEGNLSGHLWGHYLQQPHDHGYYQQGDKELSHYPEHRTQCEEKQALIRTQQEEEGALNRTQQEETLKVHKIQTIQGLGKHNNRSEHNTQRNQRYGYA